MNSPTKGVLKMKLHFSFLIAIAVAACLAGGATADHARGIAYSYSGEILAAPGANASSLSMQIETGNKPALRALIGSSQDQVFSIGSGTEVLVWQHGVPHVGATSDLQQGDYVTVRIRAPHGSSLQQIEQQQAAIVSDHAAPNPGGLPLWLFVGTVSGPQSGGHVALHVTSGNWKALQMMLGQSLDQSFTYDDGTIFLLWQGRVPTVIGPSQLTAGDKITVRIRAPRDASLSQIEASAAKHVGDHEPGPVPAT